MTRRRIPGRIRPWRVQVFGADGWSTVTVVGPRSIP